MNCWKPLETTKLQRGDETCASANALRIGRYEAISSQAPNRRRFNDHHVGSSGPKCGASFTDEDMIWTGTKVSAVAAGFVWYTPGDSTESAMRITVELMERFHEKWSLNEANGCWEWSGASVPKGYGIIKIPGERKQIYAHRLSYLIFYGEISGDMQVCHTCDNPRCVKPTHLFLGTQKDNLQDMKSKGRHLHGVRNTMSKLTEDQVRQIFKLDSEGVSQGEIGRIFGVTQSTVWKILTGSRYRDIYEEQRR